MRKLTILSLAATAALVTAAAAVAQAPAGDAEAGKGVFDINCRGCHGGLIGPNLRGVVGRKIASHPEFAGYTEALKAKSGETWGEQNLDAYLADPSAFAPGTTMPMATPDAEARANLIAYLKTLEPLES